MFLLKTEIHSAEKYTQNNFVTVSSYKPKVLLYLAVFYPISCKKSNYAYVLLCALSIYIENISIKNSDKRMPNEPKLSLRISHSGAGALQGAFVDISCIKKLRAASSNAVGLSARGFCLTKFHFYFSINAKAWKIISSMRVRATSSSSASARAHKYQYPISASSAVAYL